MEFRTGEGDGTYFRSERIAMIDGKYYIATREGDDVGPFGSKQEADQALCRFIESIKEQGNYKLAVTAALHGAWATNNFR